MIPCPVTADLNRYMRDQEVADAHADALEAKEEEMRKDHRFYTTHIPNAEGQWEWEWEIRRWNGLLVDSDAEHTEEAAKKDMESCFQAMVSQAVDDDYESAQDSIASDIFDDRDMP